MKVVPNVKAPRTVFFDIESTDLKAPFGNVLCCSFLSLHEEKVITFRLDDPKYRGKVPEDDGKLVLAIKEYLEDSFCWVGWNSKMFDIAMLNGRLTMSGYRPIEKRMHIDLMYYARRPHVSIYSSRLDAVAKTFELDNQKTDMNLNKWVEAKRLDKDAMNYVVQHCEQDVRVLRDVFHVFSPFIRNIHI